MVIGDGNGDEKGKSEGKDKSKDTEDTEWCLCVWGALWNTNHIKTTTIKWSCNS